MDSFFISIVYLLPLAVAFALSYRCVSILARRLLVFSTLYFAAVLILAFYFEDQCTGSLLKGLDYCSGGKTQLALGNWIAGPLFISLAVLYPIFGPIILAWAISVEWKARRLKPVLFKYAFIPLTILLDVVVISMMFR
ncbi:hypothetical protein [Hoeflea sp.]|uniref:hypothetical protein n=1 Tax=Hoeflea sp. TaxID=1940281 RepID=UPI003B02CB03